MITGVSGGGKTAAAKLFEDLDYVVVDNLPGELLRDFADLIATEPVALRPDGDRARRPRRRRAARVRGDARRARGPRDPPGDHLPRGARRRPDPPLQRDAPPASARGRAGDRGLDRARARDARVRPRPGRRRRRHERPRRCASSGSASSPGSATSSGSDRLAIQLISFGYKHGVPLEADLVLDVRFMKNPHYIEALRPTVRAHARGPRVRARPADRDDVPRARSRSCSTSSSRPTSRRARRGSRSRSAAPAAGTARSSSPRSSRRGSAERDFGPVVRVPPRARAVNLRRWLTVGIGVKRWLLVAFVGLIVLAVGVAHVAAPGHGQPAGPARPAMDLLDALTLQVLPYQVRGLAAAIARRRRCSCTAPTASCGTSWTRSRCGTATSRWSR